MSSIRIIENYQINDKSVVVKEYDPVYGVEFLLEDGSTIRMRFDKDRKDVVIDLWPHTERTKIKISSIQTTLRLVCPICHSIRDEQGRCRCRGNNIGYENPHKHFDPLNDPIGERSGSSPPVSKGS